MAKKKKKDAAPKRTYEQTRLVLKKTVRMHYDLQRLRIQTSGRTFDQPGGRELFLHERDKAMLEVRTDELHRSEKAVLKDVKSILDTMAIYRDVIGADRERFKGLGPAMAAVILSENDIYRQHTVSNMWSFAGLAVESAERCKACFSVCQPLPSDTGDTEFWKHPPITSVKCKHKGGTQLNRDQVVVQTGKSQRPKRGEKLPYNAFLRTKMVGVLGPNLLKTNSPWRKFYDDYKHRWESAGKGRNPGHRHQAAIRYMVKMLLAEIWNEWRSIEGLPTRLPYAEEYLQKRHSA